MPQITLPDQLILIIRRNSEALNEIAYGEITFHIANGRVVKVSTVVEVRTPMGSVSNLPHIELQLEPTQSDG